MCFFSPACGTMNHRNRQQQALCDLFVSAFSFHICRSYSTPRVSIHSLEIKMLAGINLYLSDHSSLIMTLRCMLHTEITVLYRGFFKVWPCRLCQPYYRSSVFFLRQWLKTSLNTVGLAYADKLIENCLPIPKYISLIFLVV